MKRALSTIKKIIQGFVKQKGFSVIVYQMGKVGSSSIVGSLSDVLQIHTWSGEQPIKYFSSRYNGSVKGWVISYFKWRLKSHLAKKHITKSKMKGNRVKMIIGVREPVSRNLSAYFQTLNASRLENSVDLEIENFFTYTPHLSGVFWFDVELKREFDIDIYKQEFDKEAGYIILQHENLDIFIYQFEKLATLKKQLSAFLEKDDFELLLENVAGNKPTGARYKEVKDKIKFNSEYLNLLYGSKYMKHFYSEEDITNFKQKWLQN